MLKLELNWISKLFKDLIGVRNSVKLTTKVRSKVIAEGKAEVIIKVKASMASSCNAPPVHC